MDLTQPNRIDTQVKEGLEEKKSKVVCISEVKHMVVCVSEYYSKVSFYPTN